MGFGEKYNKRLIHANGVLKKLFVMEIMLAMKRQVANKKQKVWDKTKKARDVAIGVVILIVIGIAQMGTKDGQKQIIKAKVNVGEDIIKAIIKT